MLDPDFKVQYIFASMRITILIGTMTGTAQLCAQEMELALGDDETQIEALLMDGLDLRLVIAERELHFLRAQLGGAGHRVDEDRDAH